MEIVQELEKIVGSRRVSTSANVCLTYAFNIGYTRDVLRKPDMVVMPETPEEVSDILKVANHYKVPVTFIIISNGCYRQVRLMKKILMGDKVISRNLGTDLCQPRNDFCKIAEGMGLSAQKLEKPEKIKETLQKAFSLNRPNLIDVSVDAAL